MPGLSLTLFGAPILEWQGRRVEVDTRKATALLIYLVITGKAHTRDFLSTLLWPDYDQSSARGALRRTLSTLRKALCEDCLATDWENIGLAPGLEVEADVLQFQKLLAQAAAESKAHDHIPSIACSRCAPFLRCAVELYKGDFLAGFSLRDSANFDEWQFFQSDGLRREQAAALEKLAVYGLAAGEYHQSAIDAHQWLALDPLNETAHRQLMQAYALSDQRNAALRQYRECVRILDQELGVEPMEETTRLYQAILEDRLPRPAALPPSPAPTPAAPPPKRRVEAFPPFVGRQQQVAQLIERYDQEAGQGYFMALCGELGIGKTRLAEEFLHQAAGQGAQVLAGRCYAGENALAYAPFLEALSAALAQPDAEAALHAVPAHWRGEAARLLPELGPAAAGMTEEPGAQSRFFEGLRQVLLALCAGPQPGILFLDDLHWADHASLDLLHYLVRRLRGHPIFILAAWRKEGLPANHRLETLLFEAERAGSGSAIMLGRLEAAEVSALIEAAAQSGPAVDSQRAEAIFRESGGLPFFVAEYLKALRVSDQSQDALLPLPVTVRDLLRARLAGLSETAWQLLTTAAIIGRSFDFNTLRDASGRTEQETTSGLEALLNQGFIQERGAGSRPGEILYDFAFENLRTLITEDTSLTRQRSLHRRVAEALIQLARLQREAGVWASQIAEHYRQAGQEPAAAEYYQLAGEQAQALYAHVEAITHYQAALASGHPEPALLHEAIGDLHTLQGEYATAIASYETAAALCCDAFPPRLEHKLGNVHQRRGDWELAASHFQAALDNLDPDGDFEARARVCADWSRVAHQLGHTDQAVELADCALKLAQLAEDGGRALAQAYNIQGVLARSRGDLGQARAALEESLKLARQLNEASPQVAALNNLSLVHSDIGDLPESIAYAQEALELCLRQGDRHRAAALHNNLADLLHASGQSEQAMDHLKRAVQIFAEISAGGAGPGEEFSQLQPEIWKLTEW